MSCVWSPNSPAKVFGPRSVSKTYAFSIFTRGRVRRSSASASPARIYAFSLTRSALRAAVHSSCDTTLDGCMIDLLWGTVIVSYVVNYFTSADAVNGLLLRDGLRTRERTLDPAIRDDPHGCD